MNTDPQSLAQAWVALKLRNACWTIEGAHTKQHRYHRVLGPRSASAGLTFVISPSEKLSFVESLEWPDPSIRAEIIDHIWTGAFEGLATMRYEFIDGVRVDLTAIEWHEIHSCAAAFYQCARECVTSAFSELRIPLRLKPSPRT